MGISGQPPFFWRRGWNRWVGPAITILIGGLSQLLSSTSLHVPNPPAFLVLSIVFSAFQGGLAAGFVSAIIAGAYVAYFFSNPGQPFVYTDENLRRVLVWAITMPAMAALVGVLQRRAARKDALEEQAGERLQTEAALAARARQQAVVAELGRLALAGGDLQPLFGQAMARLAETFGVEYCKVLELLPDGSALRLVAGVGWKEGLVGHAIVDRDRDSQAGFTLLCKDPVIVEDLRAETRFNGPQLLRDHGVVSGLSVIIGQPDHPFGVMGAHTAYRRAFTPDDVTLFQSVANVLATAIHRKRAEEELRRAAAHLANVTAVSPAVLYTMRFQDEALAPTWVSENVADFVGYSVAEALQPCWWASHVHPEDRAAVIAQTAYPAGGRDRLSLEYRFLGKDGSVLWIRDELRVLRDQRGAPREIVGAWSDMTERRQLEEQFLQAQKMETVGRLAGGVAHDFNNLLTVITNAADLALQGLREGDPLRTDLVEILGAAERAAALTHQLLAFSRRQILRAEVLNLNTMLADMERMLPRVLGEDIELIIVRGADLGNVRADPGQLAQIVMNLAVNSRDAMPTGGTLTLETADVEVDGTDARGNPEVGPGRYVTLAVTDTGLGMDEATRHRAFEPFFTTKAVGHGTGLGLSTVYGIVKQTGGHVTLSSEAGKGTTVRIYFPRVAEPVANRPARVEKPARGTETILVVEDESGVRKLAKRILETAGYTALEAENAGEALRAMEGHGGAVRLLLTDVVMPGTSGPELAERLRALRPEMKVLYMSGYAESAITHQGLLSQDTPFIGKPFDTSELTRKVREVLDS